MTSIINKIYQNLVIRYPIAMIIFLILILGFFTIHAKNFELDASADSLILENDKDLKIFRKIVKNRINHATSTRIYLLPTYTNTLWNIFEIKTVIYNFRENDLRNGGEGAPLTPIFHKLLVEQNKIKTPVIILNIGGIANYTLVYKDIIPPIYSGGNWKNKKKTKQYCLLSGDTGPG